MLKRWKSAAIAAALAAGAMTAATSVEARDRYRGNDDDAALAIGAGVIGLAVGAAIASGNRDRHYRRDYYYDRGYPRTYYYQRAYPRDRYYYDRQPRRHYRGDRYYRDHNRYNDRGRGYGNGYGRRGWGY